MASKNYPARGEGKDPNRFADPADILADPSLSDEEKLEALKQLENRISGD